MAHMVRAKTTKPIVRRLRTIVLRSLIGPGRRCMSRLSTRRGPIVAVLLGLLVLTASGSVALGKDVDVGTGETGTDSGTETAHVVTSTLSVSLTDRDGVPLANQQVSIVDKLTGELVYQGVTDVNGQLSVQLPVGQYEIVVGNQLKSVTLNKDRSVDFRVENTTAPEDDEEANGEDDDGDGAVDEDDEDDTDTDEADGVANDEDGATDEDDEADDEVLTKT